MESPFLLFPKEIWTMILANVDDYDDILSFLKAYPEMEDILRKTKLLWLFDQVVPFIAEWISEKELLNCRQVNKQWSRGVDGFLENHPSSRAYNPDANKILGQIWGPQDYSMVYHCQEFKTGGDLYRRFFDQAFTFEYVEVFERFRKDMRKRPPNRNPFPGRRVALIPDDSKFLYGTLRISEYWKYAITFLRKYGMHIWSIDIAYYNHGERHFKQELVKFYQAIQESLQLTPNVKCLSITETFRPSSGGSSKKTDAKSDQFLSGWEVWPNLPHLETLQIGFSGQPNLLNSLVSEYSTQIRRLEIEEASLGQWKAEYGNMFPLLTELLITETYRNWTNHPPTKAKIVNFMESINAPNLNRLHMSFQSRGIISYGEGSSQKEILGWLKGFPNLRHFHFPTRISESVGDGMLLGPDEFAPPLQSLALHGNSLKSYFFLFFDELECLEINFKFDDFEENTEPVERLQAYIQSVEKLDSDFKISRVWEMMPKLRMIILVDCRLQTRERVSREKYDRYAKGLQGEDAEDVSSSGSSSSSSSDNDSSGDDGAWCNFCGAATCRGIRK